ncbi:MAG: hypothetical protein JKY11_03330 [Alphaproteobacteria bacterium]|nr:hypothetical protein [Alphaproteobacteria bacterium]
MKKLTIGLLVLILGIGAFAYTMNYVYVSGTWKYKITVNVETPDGVKSGSTIRQLSHSASSLYIDLPDVGRAPKGKGEAVVIDLGTKGKLFGLVSTSMYRELYETFPFRGGKKIGDGIRYYNSLPMGKKGVLPLREYPRFVMFKDVNDPTSVMALNPDNFSKILGDGYGLESIEIEITDKPLVWGGVDVYISQLEDPEFWVWRKSLKYSDPRKISGNNFKRGAE